MGKLKTSVLASFIALAAASLPAAENFIPGVGSVELDVRSQFSHIRVRRLHNIRTMLFVRDNGEEAMQSQIDLNRPFEVRFPYVQYMFTSYLFCPHQERALIVGLGGGGMIHFLRHYDPQLQIDVVEIDPVVVDVADKYFGIRSDEKLKIAAADGFEHLAKTETVYDVIYLDAFLKPSAATDSTGVPLRMRTIEFYRQVQKKLKPGGVVAFNLNAGPDLRGDLTTIGEAFAQMYVFHLPNNTGAVAIGSTVPERSTIQTLIARGTELDRRFRASFSFQAMARRLGH